MKKILFTFVALVWAAAQIQAQTTARIFHTHQGKTNIYNGTEMNKAIAASVDGDTLYLGEGRIVGDFTIDKQITIMGSGQNPVILNDITVAIPDAATLTSTLMQGLQIKGDITVSKPVDRLVMKQCKMEDIILNKANVSDALFENCFIDYIWASNTYNRNISVVNSFVNKVSSDATLYYSFLNCNLNSVTWFQGECTNCIVCDSGESRETATFTNTLYCNKWDSQVTGWRYYSLVASYNNCWSNSSSYNWFDTTTGECNLNYQNYMGTDGSVIGYHGGPSPYTLEIPAPMVTQLQTEISEDSKTLKVNIKISTK